MQEHIEIEKKIDIGELSRARKLFRKIRIVDSLLGAFLGFLVVILLTSPLIYFIFVSFIQTIEPIKVLSYFIMVSFPFNLLVICLLFLVWWIPRYENKITDINLLSSYFLFRIISSITEYIEKPHNKVLIRECNFFINRLQYLFSDLNLSNLKNLSFVVKDIGNEKLDYLLALDKEIPRIYGGSNTEQITGVRNGFRQLLFFLKTNDIQSLARSLEIFKKYKLEVEEEIQNQKIWRRKFEKVKKFYDNRSQMSKKAIKFSFAFLFALLISVILVKGLVFLFKVQADGVGVIGVIITLTTFLTTFITWHFFREPGGGTFKESI
ncbi:MAG: hypothetical protein KAT65_28220 [Methanophagales archaeon]|nr:hypothetical protein [Methanophagales archaeon]